MADKSPVPTPEFNGAIAVVPENGYNIAKKSLGDLVDRNPGVFLKFYEEALKDWLLNICKTRNRITPVFASKPRVAFAEYDRLLAKFYEDLSEKDLINLQKNPLPFVTFVRKSIRPTKRINHNMPIRNIRLVSGNDVMEDPNGNQKRAVTWSRPPVSLDISYQIDIFADYQTITAFIVQRILSQAWGGIAYWNVETPFGKTLVAVRINDSVEESTESETKDETVYRSTLQVTVEGLMFHDELLDLTILTQTLQLVDDASGQVIHEKSIKLSSLAPMTVEELSQIPNMKGQNSYSSDPILQFVGGPFKLPETVLPETYQIVSGPAGKKITWQSPVSAVDRALPTSPINNFRVVILNSALDSDTLPGFGSVKCRASIVPNGSIVPIQITFEEKSSILIKNRSYAISDPVPFLIDLNDNSSPPLLRIEFTTTIPDQKVPLWVDSELDQNWFSVVGLDVVSKHSRSILSNSGNPKALVGAAVLIPV